MKRISFSTGLKLLLGVTLLLLACEQASSLITARRELMPCTDEHTDTEETNHHNVKGCHKKLTIALHIENDGKPSDVAQFVVVDRAYDRLRHEEVMFYQPLVVAIQQHAPAVTYPVTYLFSVNAGPYEVVLKEAATPGYAGCEELDDLVPQCVLEDEPATLDHAKGFCCECDGDPDHLPYHARGGQDCTDTDTNSSAHTQTSAHCFKYHPIWYSVNEVGEARFRHQVNVKVYQQQNSGSAATAWSDITEGQTLTVGSEQPQACTDSGKVSVSYTSHMSANHASAFVLDGETQRLLVPEPSDVDDQKEQKIITADPAEYLVVDKDMIDSSGSTCDKVGVDYTAFLTQDHACRKPQQSCLSNQPIDLWEQDLSLQTQNQSTEYFLTSFGTLSSKPLVEASPDDNGRKPVLLSFVHTGEYTSRIYLEINADKIVTLHKGSHGVVEEVSIESSQDTSHVRVLVSNPGLVAAEYSVQLSHCRPAIHAPELHASLMEPHGAGHFVFALQNPGEPLESDADNATCTVMLINHHGQQVASRSIVIKPQDNCYCIAQCKCKCMSSGDLACSPLSQTEYNQAGYKGHVPSPLATRGQVMSAALIFTLPQMVVSIMIVGLVLGCIKMVVGMDLWPPMGQFGLCLFKEECLTRYYEPELKGCDVVHDNKGTPINPHTGKPARLMGYTKECILNLLFFFYVPLLPIHYVISMVMSCCRPRPGVGSGTWYRDGMHWCCDCLKAPCCCCRRTGYKKVSQEAKPILPRRRSLQDKLQCDSDEEMTIFERRHFSAPSTPSKKSRWFMLEEYHRRKQAAKAIQKVLQSTEGLSSALRMLQNNQLAAKPTAAQNPPPIPAQSQPPVPAQSPAPIPAQSPPPTPTPPATDDPQASSALQPADPEAQADVTPPIVQVVTAEVAVQAEAETPVESKAVQVALSKEGMDKSPVPSRNDMTSAQSLQRRYDLKQIRKLCNPGVYAFQNYSGKNSHLSNSGKKFSLCGHLRPLGNGTFKFTLGPELTQVFQNDDGKATPLTTPLPINPRYFQELLSTEQVVHLITLKPRTEHPCLNFVLN